MNSPSPTLTPDTRGTFLGADLVPRSSAGVETFIRRLAYVQAHLRTATLWRPLDNLTAHHLADSIDRAIAELRGETPRYEALEAEHERAAAE
jgi:hypothetical protein